MERGLAIGAALAGAALAFHYFFSKEDQPQVEVVPQKREATEAPMFTEHLDMQTGGHIRALISSPVAFFREAYEKMKGPYRVVMGHQTLTVFPPQMAKSFYQQATGNLSFYEATKNWLGFAKVWIPVQKDMPRHELPALRGPFNTSLRQYIEIVVPVARAEARKRLGEGATVKIQMGTIPQEEIDSDLVLALVARASTQVLVSDPEVFEEPEFLLALKSYSFAVEAFMTSNLQHRPEAEKEEKLVKIREHHEIMAKYLGPVLARRLGQMEAAKSDNAIAAQLPEDFLQHLLNEIAAKEPAGLALELVTHRIASIIFAAYMTTTNTMKDTIVDIASRPDILKKLSEERDRVLGKRAHDANAEIDFADMKDLEYLDACVRETLRLSIAGYGPSRRIATQDVVVDGFLIKKGSHATCESYNSHMGGVFANPDEYNPDRFLEDKELAHTGFSYYPFGKGVHQCPGRFFAVAEIKSILTALLLEYDISASGPAPARNYGLNITRPPQNVTFKRRV